MHRRDFMIVLAALVAAPASADDWPTEPQDIVRKIYALSACKSGKYDCPSAYGSKEVRRRYFSKSLTSLVNRSEAESKRLDEPAIDFDPVMNTQEEPKPKAMAFSVETASEDKTTIVARWTDYDAHMAVRYDFVRENGVWKIFDMRGDANGRDGWSLRKLAVEA